MKCKLQIKKCNRCSSAKVCFFYQDTLNSVSSLFLTRQYSCFTCCRHLRHLQQLETFHDQTMKLPKFMFIPLQLKQLRDALVDCNSNFLHSFFILQTSKIIEQSCQKNNNLRFYVLFLTEVTKSNAGIFNPLCTYAVDQIYKFVSKLLTENKVVIPLALS